MIKKVTAVIIVILIIAFAFYKTSRKTDTVDLQAFFTVKRSDLNISVIETGSIKPRSQVVIKNELDSSATITYLVKEGVVVKEGDLLVEFDASGLEDDKINQEIQLQNAEASYVSAKENLAVSENQAQSDIDQAELNLEFAKLDLEKYQEKEYQNTLFEMQQNLDLAEEELARAEYDYEQSQKLYDEQYISQTELKADELSFKQKKKSVDIAKNNLSLLTDYTHKRKSRELESDVNQKSMALERTRRKAKADVTQSQANLKAKEAEFKRQQDRYTRITDQLSKTKLFAPAAGMVIYQTSMNRGRWGNQENPLEVGQTVRGREDIIYLPTADTTKADIKIHESSLKKIKIGQKVIVKVDALPDAVFTGSIARISPLPDNNWMNPDINKYPCEVYIDENEYDLKNGMNCRCEILIESLNNVLFVPLQAVIQVGEDHYVEVKEGKNYVRRAVEIGLDDNKWVHIISGLTEGDKVTLTPQLKDTEVRVKSSEEIEAEKEAAKANNQQGKRPEQAGQERGKRPNGSQDRNSEAGQRPNMPQIPAGSMKAMQKFTEADKERLKNASDADKAKIFMELIKKYSDSTENKQ